MRVFKDGAAHAILAYDGANAGKRDIQECCIWKLRREETKLYFAGTPWFSIQADRYNSGLWRMCFKIEMQQLDPKLLVRAWQRWPDSLCMNASAIESERDDYRGQRQNPCLGAQNQLIEHDAYYKQQ
jgi:hypothetical protein